MSYPIMILSNKKGRIYLPRLVRNPRSSGMVIISNTTEPTILTGIGSTVGSAGTKLAAIHEAHITLTSISLNLIDLPHFMKYRTTIFKYHVFNIMSILH